MIFGSAAGVLIRQATIVLLGTWASSLALTLAVSGLGGLLFGASVGWAATTAATDFAPRESAMVALIAGLATFGAGSVLKTHLSLLTD